MKRCISLMLLLLSVLGATNIAIADENVALRPAVLVPIVFDLQALAVKAKNRQLPIVLVYSASDCEHCERLDQEVLEPLMVSGEFNNSALIRKVMIDGIESVTDFNGKEQDAEYYSIMRDVEVTPTIEFVDSNGTQLVAPIVGYQSVDMYMSYFTAAIQASKMITSSQHKN
jgi:thioredoxin-related protein